MNKDTSNNPKDTDLSPTSLLNKERSEGVKWLSYTKTEKLVTALYMITDIIDKDEPIRSKLRTLGAEIISDISHPSSARVAFAGRIDEVISFLNIARAMGFISEMNYSILRKEFLELQTSVNQNLETKKIWLDEFLSESNQSAIPVDKGHIRIGVQKPGTLMKALSVMDMSDRNSVSDRHSHSKDFDFLKKERRYEIISAIKRNGDSATITDIKNNAKGHLVSCGEKTLQRELVSMIKDGVLDKTGEKRWSRYSIKQALTN
jgi:hypothetical protein